MTDDRTPERGRERSLVSRTSVVTMLAIGGVALAGTAAIAANIGILSSTGDDELGTLTPVQLETTTSTTAPTIPAQVVDVFVDDVTTTSTPDLPERSGTEYRVDDAGVVTAAADAGVVRIADVAPADGWTWTMAQERPDIATLVFTGGSRTLVFTAAVGPDGILRAEVTEPVLVAGTAPSAPEAVPSAPQVASAPVTSTSLHDDDHDDDDEYEHDDEYEDDDDDHDDDDHEYEGRDDDD